MVFLCIASIVWSSIALHGIALHRIAWHCIAFDYLLLYCMVLHRLHDVVQLIWRAGELPRSASSHFYFNYFILFCFTAPNCQGACNADGSRVVDWGGLIIMFMGVALTGKFRIQ